MHLARTDSESLPSVSLETSKYKILIDHHSEFCQIPLIIP